VVKRARALHCSLMRHIDVSTGTGVAVITCRHCFCAHGQPPPLGPALQGPKWNLVKRLPCFGVPQANRCLDRARLAHCPMHRWFLTAGVASRCRDLPQLRLRLQHGCRHSRRVPVEPPGAVWRARAGTGRAPALFVWRGMRGGAPALGRGRAGRALLFSLPGARSRARVYSVHNSQRRRAAHAAATPRARASAQTPLLRARAAVPQPVFSAWRHPRASAPPRRAVSTGPRRAHWHVRAATRGSCGAPGGAAPPCSP